MNLYLRLTLTILKALFAPRLAVGESVELKLRVLPTDLDINGHMNNGRYLALVDLALITLFIRSGFAKLCIKNKWRPMSGGSVAHYRRGLGLLQSFTLRFTPVGWDEFWNYCRFEFIRDDKVCAVGFMKGAGRRQKSFDTEHRGLSASGFHASIAPVAGRSAFLDRVESAAGRECQDRCGRLIVPSPGRMA